MEGAQDGSASVGQLRYVAGRTAEELDEKLGGMGGGVGGIALAMATERGLTTSITAFAETW